MPWAKSVLMQTHTNLLNYRQLIDELFNAEHAERQFAMGAQRMEADRTTISAESPMRRSR